MSGEKKSCPVQDVHKLPTTTTVIGVVNHEGKANWTPIAWFAPAGMNPPLISLTMNKNHVTSQLIKENKEFSVNLPPRDALDRCDYAGCKSGHQVDKSGLFEFEFGELKKSPLMKEARLNFSCTVYGINETATHQMVLGEVKEVFAREDCLNAKGKADIGKVSPLLFSFDGPGYYAFGQKERKAFCTGKLPEKK